MTIFGGLFISKVSLYRVNQNPLYYRVNNNKKNMGLKTWDDAPNGKIRKKDIMVAKNYLSKDEIDDLNRIVSMYLDYAESQAKNKNIMYMGDWIKKLDLFLKFNEKEILEGKGKISQEIAKQLVDNEFKKYKMIEDNSFESDFDKVIKIFLGNNR